MGLFGGYDWLFWGLGAHSPGAGVRVLPFPDVDDAEKVDGVGIWGWHDMSLVTRF